MALPWFTGRPRSLDSRRRRALGNQQKQKHEAQQDAIALGQAPQASLLFLDSVSVFLQSWGPCAQSAGLSACRSRRPIPPARMAHRTRADTIDSLSGKELAGRSLIGWCCLRPRSFHRRTRIPQPWPIQCLSLCHPQGVPSMWLRRRGNPPVVGLQTLHSQCRHYTECEAFGLSTEWGPVPSTSIHSQRYVPRWPAWDGALLVSGWTPCLSVACRTDTLTSKATGRSLSTTRPSKPGRKAAQPAQITRPPCWPVPLSPEQAGETVHAPACASRDNLRDQHVENFASVNLACRLLWTVRAAPTGNKRLGTHSVGVRPE